VTNYHVGWSGWLIMVLAFVTITLLPACDPPRGFFPELSDSTASSEIGDAAAVDPATAAPGSIVKLPLSGSVVLIGGWSKTTKPNVSTATAEFFNPATKKFTKTGSLPVSEGAGVAALLTLNVPHAEILAAGGFTGSSKFVHSTVSSKVTGNAIANVETFDPATGKFTAAAANLLTARFGATATALVSGKVLIAGGYDATGTPLDSAEVFDPATGKTTATANTMSEPRVFHSATRLPDGTVLIAGGGTDNVGDVTNTADIYNAGTNSFSATGSMSTARAAHAAVFLPGSPGSVLITGGATGGSGGLFSSFTAETYDPVGKAFTAVGPEMNDSRAFHSATLLASGKVLLVGGFTNYFSTVDGTTGTLSGLFGSTLQSAEIYDPLADTFTCVPGTGNGGQICKASMKMARAAHTATLFPSGPLAGQVLLAGGLGAGKPNTTSTELNEAELYNPTTNNFIKTGNLTAARGLHAAVLLP